MHLLFINYWDYIASHPPIGAQETPGDRPEVEEEYEPASGEAMEE